MVEMFDNIAALRSEKQQLPQDTLLHITINNNTHDPT